MFIGGSKYVVENDTDDKPTKLFIEQTMKCRNRNCSKFDEVVDTVRSELQIG